MHVAICCLRLRRSLHPGLARRLECICPSSIARPPRGHWPGGGALDLVSVPLDCRKKRLLLTVGVVEVSGGRAVAWTWQRGILPPTPPRKPQPSGSARPQGIYELGDVMLLLGEARLRMLFPRAWRLSLRSRLSISMCGFVVCRMMSNLKGLRPKPRVPKHANELHARVPAGGGGLTRRPRCGEYRNRDSDEGHRIHKDVPDWGKR